jgi:hypothetical protein
MEERVFIKEIMIENHVISLCIQNQTPIVECNHQRFANVWLLVDHIHLLSHLDYLQEFAEISNFFWKGTQFQFIESISNYQRLYKERVELEKKHPADIFEYRLTDFKLFDVSVMHPPQVEQGQLSYFVFNVTNGLPYRVVCPFPYTASTSTFVHYQLLPILNSQLSTNE